MGVDSEKAKAISIENHATGQAGHLKSGGAEGGRQAVAPGMLEVSRLDTGARPAGAGTGHIRLMFPGLTRCRAPAARCTEQRMVTMTELMSELVCARCGRTGHVAWERREDDKQVVNFSDCLSMNRDRQYRCVCRLRDAQRILAIERGETLSGLKSRLKAAQSALIAAPSCQAPVRLDFVRRFFLL